ncbi:MAG: four helix bundle protein [Patescibacteria group bacterium]|nr:four helix bundle protein [Patescibacteria group bacterium]
MERTNQFHQELKKFMDIYANKVYDYTQDFPKIEQFGLTSQLRRAALSVILNYIEGYARQSRNTLRNFLEISYGSLKESKYLIYFSHHRQYLNKEQYCELINLAEKIGAMLWGIISKLKVHRP